MGHSRNFKSDGPDGRRVSVSRWLMLMVERANPQRNGQGVCLNLPVGRILAQVHSMILRYGSISVKLIFDLGLAPMSFFAKLFECN
jgi:hypothetical protein